MTVTNILLAFLLLLANPKNCQVVANNIDDATCLYQSKFVVSRLVVRRPWSVSASNMPHRPGLLSACRHIRTLIGSWPAATLSYAHRIVRAAYSNCTAVYSNYMAAYSNTVKWMALSTSMPLLVIINGCVTCSICDGVCLVLFVVDNDDG